jgi:hypothetical protein
MAEPFGVPAGRASSEVPGAHPGGPRPLPPAEPAADGGEGTPDATSQAEESGDGAAGDDATETAGRDSGDDARPTAVAVGEGEEVLQLDADEELAAVPTRSDDQSGDRP